MIEHGAPKKFVPLLVVHFKVSLKFNPMISFGISKNIFYDFTYKINKSVVI